jgi:hypothetical protein
MLLPGSEEMSDNPYRKTIGGQEMDLYDLFAAYEVTDQAVGHAIKKLMCAGKRIGGKSRVQDLKEARWSIDRAIEIEVARLEGAACGEEE